MDKKLLERYLLVYKRFKIESASYVSYKNSLEKLYSYIREKIDTDIEVDLIKGCDNDMFEDYILELQCRGHKPSSINLYHEHARDFFEYCHKSKRIINFNPIGLTKKFDQSIVEANITKKDVLTPEEIKNVIECTYKKLDGERSHSYTSKRDRFLISLLATTGSRIKSILEIRLDWIEQTEIGKFINIPAEYVKTGIDLRLPIVESIEKYYEEYLVARDELLKKKSKQSDVLFLSVKGEKMHGKNTNESLEKLVRDKADINQKNITNHCLRKSLTVSLIGKNVEENTLRVILGWSIPGIIAKYSGKGYDKCYDEMKMKICNILG